ncbi:MAG: hypothetical protein AB8B50_17585, partial [Pirellulaceae bacterium]
MGRRAPSYRLHKASGNGVVTISGRDYYLGKHNTRASKDAYRKLINEWEASGRSLSFSPGGSKAGASGITIAMLIVDYLDHCRDYYPKTHNSEAVQTEYALKWLVDYYDEPANTFGPKSFKLVRNTMMSAVSEKTGEPLSRQY